MDNCTNPQYCSQRDNDDQTSEHMILQHGNVYYAKDVQYDMCGIMAVRKGGKEQSKR